jgi:flavin reductase (DIM6/NTAB) family NADH-FMN oxidoreductase RutF
MFYRPGEPHGLPNNPFNALVVPRPIGWISTRSAAGIDNLAPYSFFNAVAYDPPQVMFAATGNHSTGGLKDSVHNIQQTGEFVVNLATWPLREAMNATSVSAPREVDEFDYAGLTKLAATEVAPPRVAESPAHLECVHTQTVQLLSDDDEPNTVIFGRVVGIHIDESILVDGRVDMTRLQPLGRLGYLDFVVVNEVFSMERPTWL